MNRPRSDTRFDLPRSRTVVRELRPERLRTDPAGCYLTSSMELRAGLEVSLLSISQLPAEVLRELQRLRQCWESPAPPSAIAALAA